MSDWEPGPKIYSKYYIKFHKLETPTIHEKENWNYHIAWVRDKVETILQTFMKERKVNFFETSMKERNVLTFDRNM